MSAKSQSAKNPELFQSRSNSRPLNAKELMLRAKALCAKRIENPVLSCSGQIFAAFFFDGTGNNMKGFEPVEQRNYAFRIWTARLGERNKESAERISRNPSTLAGDV